MGATTQGAPAKEGLVALLRSVASIAEINPGMPIGQAMAFVQVALDPGRGPREYAEALRVPESTVSRWLLDLGQRDRGVTSVKLLEWRMNPKNLRTKQYFLNGKGTSLINRCLAALDGA
jgi:DNA-binding MarR family transcriptional regulator